MKKIITAFLLIVLTTNIGFAQMNTTPNNEVNNINKEEIQNLIDTYQEDINKIIKKEESTLVYKEYHYRKFNICNFDTRPISDIGRVEVPLCDGDYVVWNSKILDRSGFFNAWTWKGYKTVQYAGEYHQDGSLMGIIKIKKINKKTIAFYEYRLNRKLDEGSKLELKHIMVYYSTDKPVTFIATTDGNIKGVRYNNKFLSTDFSNIVDLEKIDLSSVNNPNVANDVFNIAANGIGYTGVIGITAAMAPLVLIGFATMFVTVIVTQADNPERNKSNE